jgi:hypothetical protein
MGLSRTPAFPAAADVNGGVISCQRGGVKAGHLG